MVVSQSEHQLVPFCLKNLLASATFDCECHSWDVQRVTNNNESANEEYLIMTTDLSITALDLRQSDLFDLIGSAMQSGHAPNLNRFSGGGTH